MIISLISHSKTCPERPPMGDKIGLSCGMVSPQGTKAIELRGSKMADFGWEWSISELEVVSRASLTVYLQK